MLLSVVNCDSTRPKVMIQQSPKTYGRYERKTRQLGKEDQSIRKKEQDERKWDMVESEAKERK